MKKFLSLAFLFTFGHSVLGISQSTTPRFGSPPFEDNSGRVMTWANINYTPGHTGGAYRDSIMPNASYTYVYTATPLVHADSVILRVTKAHRWDKVEWEFVADTLTAGRVVTFASNSLSQLVTSSSGNTMTVKKSKKAVIIFVFDGTAWVEESRSVQF